MYLMIGKFPDSQSDENEYERPESDPISTCNTYAAYEHAYQVTQIPMK